MLFSVITLEIKAQQLALNCWYRLLRTGVKPHLDVGHQKVHKMLVEISTVTSQPADFVHKNIIFVDNTIKLLYPSKDRWLDNQVDTSVFDICVFTNGSLNELCFGAGIFIEIENNEDSPDNSLSIPLSKTATIFQAEMLAISTAANILTSNSDLNLAIITNSESVMESLQNLVVRTKTKLNCVLVLNQVAQSNQLKFIWVPSQSGIQGNDRADELATTASVLEVMGPDPAPTIALSYIKFITKEWLNDKAHQKWSYRRFSPDQNIRILRIVFSLFGYSLTQKR